jgi:hypothetical protein
MILIMKVVHIISYALVCFGSRLIPCWRFAFSSISSMVGIFGGWLVSESSSSSPSSMSMLSKFLFTAPTTILRMVWNVRGALLLAGLFKCEFCLCDMLSFSLLMTQAVFGSLILTVTVIHPRVFYPCLIFRMLTCCPGCCYWCRRSSL